MARFQSGTEIREVVRAGDDLVARRDYVDSQRELLATGWQRVRDPAREPDYPDDPRDDALERALHDSPDDDQIWLVYADRFIELGHPRGQLMAIESAPVKNIVQRAEREADTHRLRNAAAATLIGPLVGRAGLSLKWRRGFIDHAKLHGSFALGTAEDVLFELLRHPSARFLRELTIACTHHDAQDHRLLVDLLLHASAAPPLRKLSIEYDSDDWHGFPPLGRLGTLGTIYPQLEDVRIEGDNTSVLTDLALPRAKTFAFNTSALEPRTLRAIAAAPWPVLEEIELWLGHSACTIDDVRFVLALPELRRLRILASELALELVQLLVASPIAAQITLLDFQHGAFTEHGVDMLVDARDRFPANLTCYLPRAQISQAAFDRLVDAGVTIERWWW